MKIAIASSGLGHVARGIETWALDTASALDECRRAGVSGGPGNHEVVLFAGAPVEGARELRVVPLPGLRRGRAAARRLAALSPAAAWRWGLNQPYGWEQLAFWWRLWPHLRRGRFDLLHVQDPMLAYWCRCFRRRGWVRAREILGHGTEEPIGFLGRFEYVQHLAPWHLEQALAALPRGGREPGGPEPGRHWTAIPNFVDCGVFSPGDGRQRRAARERWGIPPDAFVVGAVAAVKRHHKRLDHLIREVSGVLQVSGFRVPPFLLIAGARTDETPDIAALGERLLPGRMRLLTDVPRERMPDLYRAMDACVLPSLFEMMPIAVIEALAAGVPMIAHSHPVFEWLIGDGGACVPMDRAGALARCLADLTPAWREQAGLRARDRAVRLFAKEVVITRYLDYYRRVIDS